MQNIFKNSFVYGLGDFLKNGIAFLLIPVYTRYLKPEEYGIVAVIGVSITFLSILLIMGQNNSTMRFYFDFEDDEKRNVCISSIWFFCLGVFFIFALAATFLGKGVFETIFPQISFKPYGLIMIWTIFFSVFEFSPFVLLRAEEKALMFSTLNFLCFFVKISLIILLVVHFRMGALGKIKADLLYAMTMSLLFIYLMKRYIRFTISFKAIKDTLKFGLPLIPHQLSLWVINLSDRYCLQLMTGLSAVGVYSIGYNFAFAVGFFSSSIGMAWTPHFFKTALESDAKFQFARTTTYYFILIVFITLAVILFSKEAIYIMTTSNYFTATTIIPIVALGYFFHALYKVSSRILMYSKKTLVISIFAITSAVMNLILNILWIPRYGMIGAAWATLFSFLLLFIISYFFANKYYFVPFEYKRLGIVFSISVFIYAISLAVNTDIILVDFIAKLIMLIIFASILYLSNFLTLEEKKQLRSLFSNKLNILTYRS